jgi:addiction module RelE/StbE family toxin
MPYSLIITKSYLKQAKKFFKANQHLKPKYFKVISVLLADPFHPSLKTHTLSGKINHLHGLSLNYSVRLVIYIDTANQQIIPISIGSHDQVY